MTTVREVLLRHAGSDAPGLLWHDGALTWAEYVAAASLRADDIARRLATDRPPHVGVLLENTPEMAIQLAAAGLGGHVLVGLNTTRRGAALAADVTKADCQFVLTDEAHRDLLTGVDVPIVTAVSELPEHDVPGLQVEPVDDSLFMLIFTSGTSGDPKAVRITHQKITAPGTLLCERFGLTAADTCYVSMPLFHSNAVVAGWGFAITCGAALALGQRFSATGFLADVRRFGATYANYVGKPLAYILATPERPDDAQNPLRLAFGNEAGERDIEEFGRRFGCTVVDGFGSTENAVVVSRVPGTPPDSLGQPGEGVAILDPETLLECPRAEYDAHGAVTNLDDCVGELVNTLGHGQFAGYYNDAAATAERMRGGMYWSGDLAYRDVGGWVYFAGRTSDWLRVDGENLAAAPVERILLRHPAIAEAAVYAVPDPSSGDQLAAALVLRGELSADDFGAFLAAQSDLGPKAWPRHVLLTDDLPRTPTNKVLKRELRARGAVGLTWQREERGQAYRSPSVPPD